MSKIEAALKKARELQSEDATGFPDFQSKSMVRHGEIGRMREPRVRTREELVRHRIIYSGMKPRRVLNAFRNLRTLVSRNISDENPVIIVSSTEPKGGSSFACKNLAASIALSETRTALLVDCALENPSLGCLSLERHREGLIDFLRDEDIPIERIIHATGVPRLRLIPTGSNPGDGRDYFSLERFKTLVRELKRRYSDRNIIIDTPSIATSADGNSLSDLADCAIVVVPYARSTSDEVASATERLGSEKVLGAVINDEPGSPATEWW